MKRKFIIGVSLFALAVAVIGSGVLYAYFSDTQTANSNTFTSGELLLQVGAAAPCVETISVANMKPGDSANVADWQLQNMGNINGKLDIAVSAITNAENTNNRAEVAAGDSTTPAGELGAFLKMAFWVDADHSATWTSGDYYLKSDGTKVSFQTGDTTVLPAAASNLLDNYGGDSFANLQANIAPGSFGYFRVNYDLPAATGNTVQTDSCSFTVTFTLKQNEAT
jgi:predicted ribosomally synthesized peptide with SipW-like signal peptide